MSYRDINEMTVSSSLIERIAACMATQGIEQPVTTAQSNIYKVVTAPGWADAWRYAVDTRTVNQNPDTGLRDDVISDAMILARVQELFPPTAP